MISTPKSEKYHAQGDCESTGSSPQTGHGFSGHKASFRSTKLARRARSFKEDILEKFSQMRSPGGTPGIRSQSPKSKPAVTINSKSEKVEANSEKNTTKELDLQLRQVQVALKHFRDVISKNKLEILPGNGTIVLETVTAIHTALKHCLLTNDAENQNNCLTSATHQVYISLARLLELCDDVLLHGIKTTALESQNVTEVVTFFENSIQNLVELSQNKMATTNRDTHHKPTYSQRKYSTAQNSLDIPGQRNSLPDIPLTPRERQILEQTCGPVNLVRNSHSSESILRDTSPPPPKPPLPDGICLSEPDSNSATPPPIPPKKRGLRGANNNHLDDCSSFDNSLLGCSFDRTSLRSRSPEDSSSLLSASAGSLDSVLMQSRDEEEMKALMDPKHDDSSLNNMLQSDISDLINEGTDSVDCVKWNDTSITRPFPLDTNHINDLSGIGIDYNRLSNTESGFGSMRSSVQSFSTTASKRSSQQSSNSSKWNMYKQTSSSSSTHQKSEMHTSESIIQNMNMKAEHQQQKSIEEIREGGVIKRETSVHSFSKTLTSTTTVTNISELCNTLNNSLNTPDDINNISSTPTVEPPELPVKTRTKLISRDRRPSQYDNVTSSDTHGEHLVTCAMHQSQSTISSISGTATLDGTGTNSTASPENHPPPLPPKKKHMFQSVAYSVMAYMEMFGNCSHTVNSNGELLRHSVHTYNVMQSEWQSQDDTSTSSGAVTQRENIDFGDATIITTTATSTLGQPNITTTMSTAQSCSFNLMYNNESTTNPSSSSISPTVVIQRLSTSQTNNNQRRPVTCSPAINTPDSIPLTPPALPPKKRSGGNNSRVTSPPVSPTPLTDNNSLTSSNNTSPFSHTNDPVSINCINLEEKMNVNVENNLDKSDIADCTKFEEAETIDLLDLIDVTEYLIFKKPDEEGPDIRGGHPDALIVYATKSNKHDEKQSEFKYQDAFLTTYRTFLTPLELVYKLQQRHQRFSCHSDIQKQRAARESFSLLVSVVSDLTVSDLDDKLLQTLMEFVYQLVCNGDLVMAKALRVKILEKHSARQLLQIPTVLNQYLTSITTRTTLSQLLDFKSEQIAEQMTLLDADLFLRIEIPEVLIWAQEQKEERSPNLTCFTEHFNKMSYWARTRILEQNEAKERERYVVKFIKIMKYLRKMNNFNSYLALLSALDSAPIRRLEWQKHITEGLKEYCALIDSSSSFRAYRQALSETNPPCIPYIGLILQDLTFVHIGNSDLLPDGNINFSKRWQQFNIVDNMKRFKKGAYPFKKQERIIMFFNNFDDFMCEDRMWQISESIKPRGGRKPPTT